MGGGGIYPKCATGAILTARIRNSPRVRPIYHYGGNCSLARRCSPFTVTLLCSVMSCTNTEVDLVCVCRGSKYTVHEITGCNAQKLRNVSLNTVK